MKNLLTSGHLLKYRKSIKCHQLYRLDIENSNITKGITFRTSDSKAIFLCVNDPACRIYQHHITKAICCFCETSSLSSILTSIAFNSNFSFSLFFQKVTTADIYSKKLFFQKYINLNRSFQCVL